MSVSTPILDLAQPMPPFERGFSITLFLVPFPLFWLYGTMLGGFLEHSRSIFSTGMPVATMLLFAMFYAMIVVHESGHLVGGLIGRYRLNTFCIPPIAIVLTQTGYRVRLVGVSQPYTAMMPPADDRRQSRALFAVAGPAANLAFTVVAVASVVFAHPAAHSAGSVALSLVYIAGGFSFCFGAANLVPAHKRRLPTDGAILADALARNARFERNVALTELVGQLRNGARSASLDPSVVGRALVPDDRSLNSMRAHLIAYAARAETDLDAGARALESALASTRFATIPERQHVAVEATMYHAWYRRDEPHATAWLRHVGKISPLAKTRIDIAMAWARGDAADAVAKLEAAIANMAELVPAGARVGMTATFEDWLANARKTAPEIAAQPLCHAPRLTA